MYLSNFSWVIAWHIFSLLSYIFGPCITSKNILESSWETETCLALILQQIFINKWMLIYCLSKQNFVSSLSYENKDQILFWFLGLRARADPWMSLVTRLLFMNWDITSCLCGRQSESDQLRQTIWKSKGSLHYSLQCCALRATKLVFHTVRLQSLETSPNVLSWIDLLLSFMSRLYSLTGNNPQHLVSLKATIHKVEKNASKPAWLVVVKGLRGSSTPRVP